MDGDTPAAQPPLRHQLTWSRQVLPLLCCLAIQAMWLGVIRGLEGVVRPQPGGAAHARPSLNL